MKRKRRRVLWNWLWAPAPSFGQEALRNVRIDWRQMNHSGLFLTFYRHFVDAHHDWYKRCLNILLWQGYQGRPGLPGAPGPKGEKVRSIFITGRFWVYSQENSLLDLSHGFPIGLCRKDGSYRTRRLPRADRSSRHSCHHRVDDIGGRMAGV